VIGLAPDYATQADNAVVLALLGQCERGDRQLKGSRDPKYVGILDTVLFKRFKRATQQTLGYVFIEACDDHGNG
jgi:hypothetical protein